MANLFVDHIRSAAPCWRRGSWLRIISIIESTSGKVSLTSSAKLACVVEVPEGTLSCCKGSLFSSLPGSASGVSSACRLRGRDGDGLAIIAGG